MTTDPQAAIYDAIDAFQRTHRLPGLMHAQIRGLLAEHLARALPAVVSVPPPADRATLREQIAAAIWERQNPGRRWADCEHPWGADAEADADAVLAVLPEQTDRATLLREAADHLARQADELWMPGTKAHTVMHADADELRRMTAEQPTETQDGTDLPGRLEAVLTERFTELGNPFSEMRRHEQGPDGWPASRPVGPHRVAAVLGELMAEQRPAVGERPDTQTPEADRG